MTTRQSQQVESLQEENQWLEGLVRHLKAGASLTEKTNVLEKSATELEPDFI